MKTSSTLPYSYHSIFIVSMFVQCLDASPDFKLLEDQAKPVFGHYLLATRTLPFTQNIQLIIC